jgi:CheY-like chemotaxis protein
MARILVVDDNDNNLRLAAYMLATLGHETFSARTCEAAFADAREHRPDMVLLDLNMPSDDTLGLVRRIRDDAQLGDVPVALCTATATAEARRFALDSGFTASIPKPYELDIFRADIEAFLATHCRA